MQKRISLQLLGVTLALAMSAQHEAQAQQMFGSAEGCAVLGEIIYTQVTAAGLLAHRSGNTALYPEPLDVIACHRTAETVSRAYTSALSKLNIFVIWTTPDVPIGDPCTSSDTSRCVPRQGPFMVFSTANADFIQDSWNAVRSTVQRTLPGGNASDWSLFSRSLFEQNLGNELSRNTHGGWQAYRDDAITEF